MKRHLLLAICVFATCLCFGAKETLWIGGIYSTSFENQKEIEMILMQEGDKITGSYDYENGKIEGELKGRKLTGRWTEDKASGCFEFEFSKDGKSFEGLRSHGDNAPDKKSPSWDGDQVKNSKKKSLRGSWMLVGKETFISHPEFTLSEGIDYEDRSSGTILYKYSWSGTVEDFAVNLSCDYHHTYYDGNSKKVHDIVFSETKKGGFQPLAASYFTENGAFDPVIGTIPSTKIKNIPEQMIPTKMRGAGFPSPDHGNICVIILSQLVGIEGVSFSPGHYNHVFDTKYDRIYSPDYGEQNYGMVFWDEPCYYKVQFPDRRISHDDDFYVCFELRFGDIDNPEYLATVYHYQWNAKGGDVDVDTAPAEWFRDIFGEGIHTDIQWTIFISGTAAALAIGAIAGALGGGDATDGPEGSGNPPSDVIDDERKRRFLRDDDPYYVRMNVKENPDGTLTVTDPGGGPTQTLVPKFDEEGNRIGWYNGNFTEYDDEGLREWTRWRSENAHVFQQDTAQAERNVAEQRAINEARDEADRERGSTQTADEIKQWEKHQARLEKLADRFGIDIEDEKALKNAIKRDMALESIAGAKEAGHAAWWDERIAEAELTEKVCDTIIDAVGELSPQTKVVKEQYHYFKTIGTRAMEGIVDNKGTGHLLTKIGQGFAENAIDSVFGDNDRWEGTYLDSEKGRGVGAEVLKSMMGNIIDGDKDISEIYDDTVKAGVTKFGSDLIGDVVGDQFKSAELTHGATEAQREMLKTLYSAWFTQDISDPICEEISTDLNQWRQFIFGI